MTCIDSTIAGDRLEPDLVLVDLHPPLALPPPRGSVGFVVLSPHGSPASGFDMDELISVIRAMAHAGPVEVPPADCSRHPRSDLDRLTPRERETLAEMAQGKNNAAIADSLFLSQRAVEKHINSIFSKLSLTEEPKVDRRVKAVLLHLEASRPAA